MCGRFSQGEPSHRISDYFGAYPDEDLPAGLYNVPPTEIVRALVVRDGARRLAAFRWGFAPLWTDVDAGPARSWINARAESAAASPAFGPALRSRRCVIPADAFYEWDRSVTPRQPYAIGPADGGFLALAAIWSGSRDAPPTTAILTTTPNALVAPVHDRMPVILSRDLLDAWLDPSAELAELEPMLAPAPEALLRIWPVSTEVNRVASDGRQLLEPVAVPVPSTLGLI
jgi:putative SOS response-associated peptidase YedK